MRKSGAFPLARTNMPDFGLRYHTESDLYGATINPWNALLTPGGSSGGDAVAVATGMVPIGLGNDYGGSIRWPAQCCGVSGLRPGRGRIPFYTKSMSYGTIAPSLRMMAVQGPLARKIGDLRIALEIMSSSGSTDPCWIPSPPGNNLTKSFRVAAIFNPGGFGVDASVSDGVKKAASILERNGGIIEEIDSSSLNESAQFWIEMISADIRSLHLEAINKNASIQSKTFIEELLSLQNGKSLGDYVNYLARINGIAQSWQDFFQKYDAVIGPVCSRNPFKVGADIQGVASAKSLIESQALTVTVNLLGLPSVALPVAVTDNIPQSVQIIGPMFNETRCLDLAQMIENEVGIFTPVYPGKARI
jgi:amidase